MFQMIVFNTGYYIDPTALPKHVYHALKLLVDKFGENLDVAPVWARHRAYSLARKFIGTTF